MVDPLITLYDSSCLDFSNNGLGSLPDAISCIVTEERNGEFELKLEYPITGRKYSELLLRRIILAKPNQYAQSQPFRIYSCSKPINGIVTFYAEHISYDLSGYPLKPFKVDNLQSALVSFKSFCPINNKFTFWSDKTDDGEFNILKPLSIRSALGGNDISLLNNYGGEFEFDRFNVKLHQHRGQNRGVSIRYGKNLTDLNQEENCSAVYTGVYPFWYSESEGLVDLGDNKTINAPGTYDFTRILPLDLSSVFSEKPSVDELKDAAQIYIESNNIGIPSVSLTVSFIPLSQTEDYKNFALLEDVHLCDTVNIVFPEMNVDATAECIKTVYDVLSGKYTEIELGDPKSNLATTISGQAESISKVPNRTFMEQAIDNATKLITGGLGGYVLLHSSTGSNKYPDEILVMDSDSIKTATKVWRWNQNGFGFSQSGYNGPYSTAITMDGSIVADFITAGELNGSVIKAGTITSVSLGKDVTSYMTLLSDKISLVVSGTGSDNTINTASIITAINNDRSEIRLSADKINLVGAIELSASNSGTSSKITLKQGATEIDSTIIIFTGLVTFNDLESEGKTIINGARIKTGTLSADKFETTEINKTSYIDIEASIYCNGSIALSQEGIVHWGSEYAYIKCVKDSNERIVIYSYSPVRFMYEPPVVWDVTENSTSYRDYKVITEKNIQNYLIAKFG